MLACQVTARPKHSGQLTQACPNSPKRIRSSSNQKPNQKPDAWTMFQLAFAETQERHVPFGMSTQGKEYSLELWTLGHIFRMMLGCQGNIYVAIAAYIYIYMCIYIYVYIYMYIFLYSYISGFTRSGCLGFRRTSPGPRCVSILGDQGKPSPVQS